MLVVLAGPSLRVTAAEIHLHNVCRVGLREHPASSHRAPVIWSPLSVLISHLTDSLVLRWFYKAASLQNVDYQITREPQVEPK